MLGKILILGSLIVGIAMLILSAIPMSVVSPHEMNPILLYSGPVLFHFGFPFVIAVSCSIGIKLEGQTRESALVLALSVALLFGFVSEWEQIWAPTRVVSSLDLGADLIGALLGSLVVFGWDRLKRIGQST